MVLDPQKQERKQSEESRTGGIENNRRKLIQSPHKRRDLGMLQIRLQNVFVSAYLKENKYEIRN